MRHGRADSGVEADSAHQSAPESGTTRVRLGQLECTTRTPSHARSCPTRIPRVRLGGRVGHDACTTRIPRIRLGRRVAHRVVQLGIRVGTRRSDSAVRVGGPAARLGAREGPRVGAKESDSGPARGPESDRVCTVGSQVPVATLPNITIRQNCEVSLPPKANTTILFSPRQARPARRRRDAAAQ